MMLVSFCCNISAQTHLTFMGIPITGTRKAMVTKLKAKGFTEKIQENDVGVELKGKYLGKDVRLCVYNSNHCCPVKIVKYHLSSNSRNSFLDIQTLI